jgi:outer membrane receptor protein involved in Fe transport
MLDNNDNISVLGRSGVKIFINGKNLPLAGDDLTSYLENLSSEQIDRIDIITNPGAKYEAEGNAGIIDIRLKKSKELGANGNLSSSFGQGRYARYNTNLGLNFRSSNVNVYGNFGYNNRRGYMDRFNQSEQNNLFMDEITNTISDRSGYIAKMGLDYYLDEHNTIGILVSTGDSGREGNTTNRIEISPLSTRTLIDSILVANNISSSENSEFTYNMNYVYLNKDRSINFDADYGRYRNDGYAYQPNQYFDAQEAIVLSEYITEYETPNSIDIYTLKFDFEDGLLGGKLGLGAKFSRVITDNTYLFYEIDGESSNLQDNRSNNFKYAENVYAGYVNYTRGITKKINFNGGVRLEVTDVFGELTAFDPSLQEDPVDQMYPDIFPSMGLSYKIKEGNSLNLNYGRRLNRPNYNVLNPFKEQESELSFRKGNPFLKPEIVNNYEIGYTHAWRYNVKISYSHTKDQISRLIGPDDVDPRAGFLSWDNLASQDVFALNFALPFEFTNWWNAFFNLSGSYINNQADYGDGAVVDLQAWSYNVFSQQTFKLPYKLTTEVSGWYSGPGIWGGVFEYDPSFTLNLGLQRKFLKDNLNVKVSVNDLFHESGWSGKSVFNGLVNYGRGYWDSRRIDINISYKFGNSKIKSRQRKTGIETETRRLGDGG